MGIFSFDKKNNALDWRNINYTFSQNSRNVRVQRRPCHMRRMVDTDVLLSFGPTLSEKQRARRRLIGASALLVATLVLLPVVFNSHPKFITKDISINILYRPVTKTNPMMSGIQLNDVRLNYPDYSRGT